MYWSQNRFPIMLPLHDSTGVCRTRALKDNAIDLNVDSTFVEVNL